MSAYCRDLFVEVVLVSGHILHGRVSVGMFSARSALCRDMFVEVGFVSGRVRRCRLSVAKCTTRFS